MKIIVPIRRVPDPDRPIRVTADASVDVVRWITNRLDEAGVDEAVRLRAGGIDTEIIAVAVGTDMEEHLLAALARGANRGYAVEAVDIDAPVTAKAIAGVFKREQADLILMGDTAADAGETGPRLAGMLGIAQATNVREISLAESRLRVTRELPRAREILDIELPALLTLAPSFPAPDLISLYAIVDAAHKPVTKLPAPQVSTNGVVIKSVESAPRQRAARMVQSVEELVTALREEARVI
jgi:electron transfer flavoprotein beta subunit